VESPNSSVHAVADQVVDQLEVMMSTGAIIAIVVVVLVVVALAATVLPAQLRRRHLRARFGPEYDRVVGKSDDRRVGERTLADREKRHGTFALTTLSDVDRAAYAERWTVIQERFVDEPAAAVCDADATVTDLMADLGYPTDGFDQQADDLSVRHADNVAGYRTAHEVVTGSGDARTDDLRQALLDYRELFRSLLGHDDAAGDRPAVATTNA
jgi:hypothetical protein